MHVYVCLDVPAGLSSCATFAVSGSSAQSVLDVLVASGVKSTFVEISVPKGREWEEGDGEGV
jgi:hypothetical protein